MSLRRVWKKLEERGAEAGAGHSVSVERVLKQLEASEREEEGTGSVAEIGNQRPRFLSS